MICIFALEIKIMESYAPGLDLVFIKFIIISINTKFLSILEIGTTDIGIITEC